jgi:hypothetical protein
MADVRVSAALGLVARRRGGHGDGAFRVPGCLTSESEERETWTAESCVPRPRTEEVSVGVI